MSKKVLIRLDAKLVYDCPFCAHSEIIAEGDDVTSIWRRASFSGRKEDKELIRCKLNPRSRWRRLWKKNNKGWEPPRSCRLPRIRIPKGHKISVDHLKVMAEALREGGHG